MICASHFTTVIQGFGHCGRNLHLRCMRKLMASTTPGQLVERVEVVDPFIAAPNLGDDVRFHRRLPAAARFQGSTPILHICTPPESHLDDVQAALAAGYRYIILEKPLAPSAQDAQAISQLAQHSLAKVLVVAVWANSALTAAMTELVQRPDSGPIDAIKVVHNKARFTRTMARQNEHIFDIEMPHQISVVLPFMDADVKLVSAQTSDLMINDACRSSMGRGEITLAAAGTRARLVSSLSHPVRERSLLIEMRNHTRLVGNFPVSGDDSYSQLALYSPHNQLLLHEIFDDDPLTSCLRNYYAYFFRCQAGRDATMPNGASLEFNCKVVALIDQAKRLQTNYPIHLKQRSLPASYA